MNGTIFSKCQDGRGLRHDHAAEGYLFAPDGTKVPGPGMCAAHAQECIDEYSEKLGESWSFAR